MHRLPLCVTLLLITFTLAACETEPSGDPASTTSEAMASDTTAANPRIVFFGDSITEAGAQPGGYVSLIADTLEVLYPDRDIDVIGAGISGHKVPDLQARLERDVLSRNPTQVVIYIGINDVWHWFEFDPEGTEREAYEAGLRDLVAQIQEAGASVLLCTPSVIGEKPDASNEADEMLEEYAQVSRDVAEETGAELCDLRAAFVDYLKANNAENAEEGILTTDGVHLNAAGNRFVAEQILPKLDV